MSNHIAPKALGYLPVGMDTLYIAHILNLSITTIFTELFSILNQLVKDLKKLKTITMFNHA